MIHVDYVTGSLDLPLDIFVNKVKDGQRWLIGHHNPYVVNPFEQGDLTTFLQVFYNNCRDWNYFAEKPFAKQFFIGNWLKLARYGSVPELLINDLEQRFSNINNLMLLSNNIGTDKISPYVIGKIDDDTSILPYKNLLFSIRIHKLFFDMKRFYEPIHMKDTIDNYITNCLIDQGHPKEVFDYVPLDDILMSINEIVLDKLEKNLSKRDWYHPLKRIPTETSQSPVETETELDLETLDYLKSQVSGCLHMIYESIHMPEQEPIEFLTGLEEGALEIEEHSLSILDTG
jgi:hypothetical protein